VKGSERFSFFLFDGEHEHFKCPFYFCFSQTNISRFERRLYFVHISLNLLLYEKSKEKRNGDKCSFISAAILSILHQPSSILVFLFAFSLSFSLFLSLSISHQSFVNTNCSILNPSLLHLGLTLGFKEEQKEDE